MGTVPTCRPSRSRAGRWTSARTSSRSASSSTRWRPGSGRSRAIFGRARDVDPARHAAVGRRAARRPAAELGRVIGRCLEKSVAERFPSAQELRYGLRGVPRRDAVVRAATAPFPRPPAPVDSGAERADEGFWVAVLPFKYAGDDADLAALADGLTEEIVTGLSRFSYLRVIARGSTMRYAERPAMSAGRQGARRPLRAGRKPAPGGSQLRVAVQLVDTATGAHLWAETYDRAFRPEEFSSCRTTSSPHRLHGRRHARCPAVQHERSGAAEGCRSNEPVRSAARSFGYNERFTPEDLPKCGPAWNGRSAGPGNADCWAMLSVMYANEYGHWDNAGPDSLDRRCEPRGRRSKRRRCIPCPTTRWPRPSSSSESFRPSESRRNGRFR